MTREEAKTIFLNRGYIEVDGGSYFDGNKWRESIAVISEWLKEDTIKALEQEPKTGHWIYCYYNGFGRKICKCSKCNWAGDTTGYKYCPNCGAKME